MAPVTNPLAPVVRCEVETGIPEAHRSVSLAKGAFNKRPCLKVVDGED